MQNNDLYDLDESINDLEFVMQRLNEAIEVVSDGSSYNKGLPKRNTLCVVDLESTRTIIERRLRDAKKIKKYGGAK